MKNQLKAPISISIFLLIFLSTSLVQAQKYDLKLRLEEGNTFTIKQTSDQNINISVMGMSQDVKQTVGYEYKYLVEKAENDLHTIKVTYEAMENTRDGAQGSFSYNSRTDSAPSNPEAQYMAALIGESFYMVIDQMGEIQDIKGTDALLEKGLSKMEGLDEATREAVKVQLQSQFGDEAMKSSMGQISAFFPKKKVKVGKSWKHEFSTNTIMAFNMKSEYTLDKVEDGKAYLSVKTDIEPGEGSPMEMGEMSMDYELAGVQNATMVLDLKTGWTLEGITEQDLGGNVKISNPSIGVLDAPMTIESKTSLKSN